MSAPHPPLADPQACNTFVCVLKTGGEYGASHVQRLREQLHAHAPHARLICLSDLADVGPGVEVRRLQHELPGWFSKLEIFALDEPAFFYMDLDVVITDDIRLPIPQGLHLLRGFKGKDYNSSIMLVRGDFRVILDRFLERRADNLQAYSGRIGWGDQDFIKDSGLVTGAVQDLYPVLAGSWKSTLRYRMGWLSNLPQVLVFHGKPKPQDLHIRLLGPRRAFVFAWAYLLHALVGLASRAARGRAPAL